METQTENATFAGGCFWCTEAVFKRLNGVLSVTPGYTGGTVENPTYQQVCLGKTGHAEAVNIVFDPTVLPYRRLLDVFFTVHDPTSKNRQGADVGSQYRSAVFYRSPEQQRTAREAIHALDASGKFPNLAVTEIVPFSVFYPAEDYHRNYYDANPSYPYCTLVIGPKLKKLLTETPKSLLKAP